jgi:hypothetical protein
VTASSSSAASRSVWRDGSNEKRPAPLALAAGSLSLVFADGGLRYIRLGEREIVRRVYCAVRDANWGTVPDRISNLRADVREDAFRIEFDVENQQAEIDFAWQGLITGESSGRIVCEMDGVARSTFRKNRIGFCVLHPMEIAGTSVLVRHADGRIEQAEFPRYIAPHNPFLDVVGMRHTAGPGVDVELTFEGDLFETEDQRNWIDASFKTFCTPLSRPFPVEIRAGERIAQRVRIELRGQAPPMAIPRQADRGVELAVMPTPVGPLPRIGFSLPHDAQPLSAVQVARLRLLRPAHLRCELRLSSDYVPNFQRAIDTAAQLGTALDVALFVGDGAEGQLRSLVQLLDRLWPPIARWAVFPDKGWVTTLELAGLARRCLRSHDPHTPIGGGTPASFLELNRGRPPADALDFVCWSMQPQEHAFDNSSLVETLAAQAVAVESARQFTGDLPLVVGPITLKRRINPYATAGWPPETPAGQLPTQVDVRQLALIGAGWTLGSIKHLSESGVRAVTYYELVGWRGLIERDEGSPLPELFPSLPGGVFPLYHVFADVAEIAGAEVLPLRSSDPLRVDGLALRTGPLTRAIVANLSGRAERAALPCAAAPARIRILEESNVQEAMHSPEAYRAGQPCAANVAHDKLSLDLAPYALALIDWK